MNSATNLLEGTVGLASFLPNGDEGGDRKFYLAGGEGLTLLDILENGNPLQIQQSVTDTAQSMLTSLDAIEVFTHGGDTWLIGAGRSDNALNVFQIDESSGQLTFTSVVTDLTALSAISIFEIMQIGSTTMVVATNAFAENLSVWSFSDSGTLAQINLLQGSALPLGSVQDMASFTHHGNPQDRDGLITAAFGEGLTLWDIDSNGGLVQRDTLLITSVTDVDVGTYSIAGYASYLLAGRSSIGTVEVVEVVGDTLVATSTCDLKADGFFGNVSAVRSFEVDGVRLVTVVTGVGEILLMAMQSTGDLELLHSWQWAVDPTAPVRNADDIEMVFDDGQAYLVIAGTQPQTEANLDGVSLFRSGGAADRFDGTGAVDQLLGFGRNDKLRGFGGDDSLFGGKGTDTLSGGTDDDLLGGGLGSDLILGGSGNDTISGGVDTTSGGSSADTMDGGTGVNLSSCQDASGLVVINMTTGGAAGIGATGDVCSNFRDVTGSRFNDSLTGDGQDTRLDGDDGDDDLNGGSGADTLIGAEGDNSLSGQGDNDELISGGGTNVFFGGTGDDLIRLGPGQDLAVGGAGADTFWLIPSNTATDRIKDFTPGADKLDLSALPTIFPDANAFFAALQTLPSGHSRLTVAPGGVVLLLDVTEAQISAGDLLF